MEKTQSAFLVEFMEKNPNLATNALNKQESDKLWKDFAQEANKRGAVEKTAGKWRKVSANSNV